MLPIFSRKRRPVHMGKYPMERLRRRATPTTLITDDVQRVAKRADFFVRAFHGDLGEKPKSEIKRFITKSPLNRAFGHVMWKLNPAHRGEPAEDKAPLPDDAQEVTDHIKALCHFMDADVVGVCAVPDYAWYSHNGAGEEIPARHKYAVVLLIDQGWDTFAGSSGDDWISGAQSYRAYLRGAEIACMVSDYIRRLGWPAQAHSNADSDVLHLPLVLLAGLGELSRIGEVVINPFLGPRFKTAVVTTDLPLVPDRPVDFGLQDFCAKCKKCARECPAQAIPFGDKVLYNGYEMWRPDVEKCARYRVTNQKGAGCGRCMKMCPWNKEGLLAHRAAVWAAIRAPFLRRFLIWLDDKLGYGRRNPVKKWWLDLETTTDGVMQVKDANARDVHLDRPTDLGNAKIAMYPPDVHPAPGMKKPVPVDRKAGLEATRNAEQALKDRSRKQGG